MQTFHAGVLKMSTDGFYQWFGRSRPLCRERGSASVSLLVLPSPSLCAGAALDSLHCTTSPQGLPFIKMILY